MTTVLNLNPGREGSFSPQNHQNNEGLGIRGMAKSQSALELRENQVKSANQANFFSNRNSQQSQMKSKQSNFAAMSLYQGGFSQTLSTNTLRNSHSSWSFPKGDRFIKIRIENNAKMLLLPSTLDSTKAVGLGYGDKNGLMIVSGRDSPPPNSYKLRSQFEKLRPNQGKSFGLPHSAYAKVYLPDSKYGTTMVENPGPGAYDFKNLVGMNSKKYTLKSRIKPADSATRDNPPPNTYHPNFNLSEQSKFAAITFGFGNRCNVTGQIKETPGPGTYKISSVFDRFKRLPGKQFEQFKSKGGLTPNMANYRTRSTEKNDLDILDQNNDL